MPFQIAGRYRLVAVSLAALAFVALIAAGGQAQNVKPLLNAHAHNDYWHDRPLFDALDRGFTSVEADIFLVDGKLLVGHAREELKPDRTLEKLYLEPLLERVKANAGNVYAGGDRFFLLVDIKSGAESAYPLVHEMLSNYAEMLTVIDRAEVRPGAVTVVITGNRPIATMESAARRYAGVDGRLSDLESDAPAHWMPMISDNWMHHFTWVGAGQMPASERRKLREVVAKAHEAGRILRFWATPENEDVWRELRSAGVDLIGTDQLDRLAEFLRDEGARPAR